MRLIYTRLFAGEDGVSHFEDIEQQLLPGFSAPPAGPLYFAEFLKLGQSRWVGGLAEWDGGIPHLIPRCMLVISVKGQFEVTAGDGVVRTFKPGDVIVAEDTWGTGHASKIPEESINLFIDLA